ncbi:carboxymuconolactone decarboxylase family protein [Pseudomonas sp. gcc21]|uniref:carboxymuconolactone decarboxylase family protein n=1 Tax=Pseudomonas sp. gcc21 TaxID=2726989 RepID=UPI0014525B6C|nr:carboxymuconolactone decarboxylase family protein [Pseudomonas sp. gcc21]QJD57718.1 carboxymuconolactone decarboxylase family protein [Pseudomonas sp. gcc21]
MYSRLSELRPEAMSLKQKEVLEEILSGPRQNLDGPFLAWIHSPELANHAQRLGAFCRYHSSIPLRLSELAILATAALWQSQAEWQIHEPIALQNGVSRDVVNALRAGREPDFTDEQERVVYRLTHSLYEARRVPEPLYNQARDLFGEPALVELVGILGYYAMVAMTLNVFEVRLQTDQSLPFAEPGS